MLFYHLLSELLLNSWREWIWRHALKPFLKDLDSTQGASWSQGMPQGNWDSGSKPENPFPSPLFPGGAFPGAQHSWLSQQEDPWGQVRHRGEEWVKEACQPIWSISPRPAWHLDDKGPPPGLLQQISWQSSKIHSPNSAICPLLSSLTYLEQ